MATKLKDLKLTSVDLVRAGANQEADICLFKSADPAYTPEATEGLTEPEKNIFKRFLDWLRENPTEAENEPQNHIEKADDPAVLDALYKSAIIESITSITNDQNLNDDDKLAMVEKSLDQFYKQRRLLWDIDDEENERHEDLDNPEMGAAGEQAAQYDEIEEVHKFNPNHDSSGKFSAASSGAAPGGGASFSAKESAKTINAISSSMNNGGEVGERWKKVRDILQAAPVGTVMTQTGNRGVKFQYEKTGEDEWTSTTDGYKSDSKTQSMSWVGNGNKPDVEFHTKDKAPTRDEVKDAQNAAVSGQLDQWIRGAAARKSARFAELEEVEKFNQNHDSNGRFAAAPGGAGAGAAGGGAYKGGRPYLMTTDGSPHSLSNIIQSGTEGDILTATGKARNPKELAEGLNKLDLYYKFSSTPKKETDKFILLEGTHINRPQSKMIFGVKKTPPSGPPVAR